MQEVEKAEELVSVTAEAEEGYEFVEWQKNGEHFADEAKLESSTIELKDQDKYSAVFKEIEEEVEEEAFPAGEFSGSTNNINVKAVYEKDTFPKGTQMFVSSVSADSIRKAVNGVTEGEVEKIKAVDITFWYGGKEIQPEKPISVSMKASGYDEGKQQSIVHVANDGKADVVAKAETSGGIAESEFIAEHFLIYAVVETGTDARLTVNFEKANGETVAMMINKRQFSHIEQYIFDPGSGAPDGALFMGWTDDKNFTVDTKPMTVADIRKEIANILNAEGGISDGQEITYYAMAFDAYDIVYRDELGITIKTVQARFPLNDQSEKEYTVTLGYTPYPVKDEDASLVAEFVGWQQIEPVVPGKEIIYQIEIVSYQAVIN